MHALERQVGEHCQSLGRLAVACSGGIDSVALLQAVVNVGLKPLVLHVDHGIHEQSETWAQFVQQFAQKLGCGFFSQRLTGLDASTPSLENAARIARHHALQVMCIAHEVDCLLLAHHANDQAETVLLNLLRGTGLAGVGMPVERIVGQVKVLKPWLSVTRADIQDYASHVHLQWIEDPSNEQTHLRRNAVRHTLWPVITAVEPRSLSSLLRFSELALAAASTQNALAKMQVKRFTKNTPLIIDWYNMVKDQSEDVHIALLRAWLDELGCKPPTQAHAKAIVQQLNARTGDGLRCTIQGLDCVMEAKLLHVHSKTIMPKPASEL